MFQKPIQVQCQKIAACKSHLLFLKTETCTNLKVEKFARNARNEKKMATKRRPGERLYHKRVLLAQTAEYRIIPNTNISLPNNKRRKDSTVRPHIPYMWAPFVRGPMTQGLTCGSQRNLYLCLWFLSTLKLNKERIGLSAVISESTTFVRLPSRVLTPAFHKLAIERIW